MPKASAPSAIRMPIRCMRSHGSGTTRAVLSSRIMSEPTSPLALGQINIVVRDMRKSLAFYRLLGLSIEEIPLAEWAPHHASGVTSNGVRVEFDSIAFAKQWNPGLDEAKLGSATIPFFHVPARDEVDRVHATGDGGGAPEPEGARGRVLGSALRDRRGSGRELGRDHEPDRRVEAPPAAASAAHLIAIGLPRSVREPSPLRAEVERSREITLFLERRGPVDDDGQRRCGGSILRSVLTRNRCPSLVTAYML